MKLFYIKVIVAFLSVAPFCISSQAFATDDVNKAVESLAKLYKVDKLLNETVFDSFAATDSSANAGPKYTYKSKKSGSPGFKIKSLKSLQYKIDSNQIIGLKNNSLSYVFTIQF